MVLEKYNPKKVIVFSRDEMKQWEMAKLYGTDIRDAGYCPVDQLDHQFVAKIKHRRGTGLEGLKQRAEDGAL